MEAVGRKAPSGKEVRAAISVAGTRQQRSAAQNTPSVCGAVLCSLGGGAGLSVGPARVFLIYNGGGWGAWGAKRDEASGPIIN